MAVAYEIRHPSINIVYGRMADQLDTIVSRCVNEMQF